MRIDEELAQALLTREIPIDFQSIREASETLIGQHFLGMVGSAISLTGTTGQAWEYCRVPCWMPLRMTALPCWRLLQNLDVGLMILGHPPAIDGAFLTDWHRL